MKRRKQSSKEEKMVDVLKKLAKRVEVATINIYEITRDLKFLKLGLQNVEHNTGVMKVDIEKIAGNIDDLIEMNSEILAKMVTRKEFEDLSQRVATLGY